MAQRLCLLVLACLTGVGPARASSDTPPAPQYLVVTAPAFRAALEPLCAQRKAEGMKVRVIETGDVLSDDEIRAGDVQKLAEHVQKLCKDHAGPSYVVLAGAVEAGNVKFGVPALRGTISRMKDQPTDNAFGCLDGERLPTVAVGRLPARSEEEMRAMVRKTLAFERDSKPGEWRQRLTVLAGVPAFNPLVDRLVEGMAMSRFGRLDPMWTVRAVYHNPGSRFCVPDDRLNDRARGYVEQGQVMTVYLGHSWAGGLYAPKTRYLDRQDWAELQIPTGAGVFAIFGCNGCQLAGPEGEGYGLAAMRNPHGPVAVTGSHGICFAAMCQLGADGVLSSVQGGKYPDRLAEVWLALKAGISNGKMDALTFKMLDSVDGDSRIPQATQRQEHLEMFMLLGDPALRMPRITEKVQLAADSELTPGAVLKITGEMAAKLNGGRLRLTLERPLTSEPADLEAVPPGSGADRSQVVLANHERANRFVLRALEVPVREGRFAAEVRVPETIPWPRLLLRAYAATERHEALGVLTLDVKK